MNEKNKKPITNQPVRFLIEGSLSPKNSVWFLEMWFLISGFLLYTVTGKIIEIKTENAEATATHQ